MKVVAKKRYYEEDLYSVSGYGGGFTEKKLLDFAGHLGKLRKIEHKEGDFKKWEVRVEKYCCDDLKEHGRPQMEWNWHENPKEQEIGMFLPFQGYDEPDYVYIDYCPFCGEKIEMVEEK